MDDDKTLNFCTECGANIHQNDEYCPACGYKLKEYTPNYTSSSADPRYRAETLKRLNIVIITGAIWAVFAILNSIYGIMTLDSAIDSVREVYSDESITFTEDFIELLRSIMIAAYSILIVSGIFAAISAVLCWQKKFYNVAYWSCIIGSILSLIAFIPGIVGIILSGRIKAAKSEFKN